MPQAVPPSSLKCVAVNVNGLRDKQKRLKFFDWLLQQRFDVVVLSETHSKDDGEVRRWVQEGAGKGRPWQGRAYWCHNTQPGSLQPVRGVAILLRDGVVPLDVEVTVQHMDSAGRLLRVGWECGDSSRWSVLAVYAPSDSAGRSSFFSDQYWEALQSGDASSNILVGGDFNCACSPEDVLPMPGQQPQASSRLVGGTSLALVNSLFGLVDCYRQLHPRRSQPTHYQQTAASSSSSGRGAQPAWHGGRIDYFFVSEQLVQDGWLRAAQQHARQPSDHRPVSIKLAQPSGPLQGDKRFIFPNELLGNQEYMVAMPSVLSRAVSQWQQQHPGGDPLALWEHVQQTAATETLVWHLHYKQRRQQQLASLRMAVKSADSMLSVSQQDPQLVAAVLQAEQALTDYTAAAAQQRIAATEPLWEVYGESSTYWFHRLGRPPPESQLIAALQPPDQQQPVTLSTPAGVTAAGDLLADYYDSAAGGIFAAAHTDAAAQQDLLAAVDKRLSAADQQQCEGPAGDGTITLDEAKEALDSLPRGKAPGPDGLTYEFYVAFWDDIGQLMVDAFNSVFTAQQQSPQLSQRQRLGYIALIYKGNGKPRQEANSYRPITLLNADVKILAKVLALRYGSVLDSVIDATQTGFVPGRDIADNVLCHLEEIDYLTEVQQPGCVLFLDFEKAYDRLNRDWLFKCIDALGFPSSAVRWVQILLQGTAAQILYNRGFLSRQFSIDSGCAQGSPISPLLYVIAAQPLAAKCRQVQQQPGFDSINMPDAAAAPACHQHADDTTLHAASVGSLQLLLVRAVRPYCRASGGQLNLGKSKGMVMGSHAAIVGVEPVTGVPFQDTSQEPVRHLGILLSSLGVTQQFSDQLFQERLRTINWRIRHWARYDLSLLGRCEVAKQVLASTLSYHIQFVSPSVQLLQLIHRRLLGFVLGKGLVSAEAAAQLKASPSAAVASLPKAMGGLAQVDVRAHAVAMQAKVAARLLWPHRQPWKVYMQHAWERHLPGLGVAVLVQSTRHTRSAALNARHALYIDAFSQVGLHRHVSHSSMSQQQIRLERLVGNLSIGKVTDGEMFARSEEHTSELQSQSNLVCRLLLEKKKK